MYIPSSAFEINTEIERLVRFSALLLLSKWYLN
jgi:hypothetical protein